MSKNLYILILLYSTFLHLITLPIMMIYANQISMVGGSMRYILKKKP